jgi:hypothetical protein
MTPSRQFRKKGVKRAVLVASIIIPILGICLSIYIRGDDVYLLNHIMAGFGLFCLVWLIYYFVLWITKDSRNKYNRNKYKRHWRSR